MNKKQDMKNSIQCKIYSTRINIIKLSNYTKDWNWKRLTERINQEFHNSIRIISSCTQRKGRRSWLVIYNNF